MKNYLGSAVFALSSLAYAGAQEAPQPPCAEQDKSCSQQAPAPEQAPPAQAAPAQQAPGAQQAPCAEQDKACADQGQQQAPTEQQQDVVVVDQKASCQEGKLVELRDVNHKFAAKSVEGAVIRTNLDGTMSLLLEVKVKSGPLGLFTKTENRVVTLPIVSRLRDACGTEITVARLDTRIGSAGLYEELVLKDHRFDNCSTMPHLTEVTYTTIDPSFKTTISHFAGYALVDGR